VPVDPADVAPDKGAHARLEALCRNISPALAAAPIKARQACFRPVTEDGLPLIGAVPGVDGARRGASSTRILPTSVAVARSKYLCSPSPLWWSEPALARDAAKRFLS